LVSPNKVSLNARAMRLYEFEGYELFRRHGIPVPDYELASTPDEACRKAPKVGFPLVVKAQVLTGGRYLAGGVQVARSPEHVEDISRRILGLEIRGWPVAKVLLTRQIKAEKEFYLGVAIDEYHGTPVVILSTEGGVSINEVARERPESLISRRIPISTGLTLAEAEQIARELGLDSEEAERIAKNLKALYDVFRSYDALVAEINPMVLTHEGKCMALDAKIELDDSGLKRHPNLHFSLDERTSSPLERKGREIGVTYVELDGDIGIISSGAGLGMATMDIISRKFRPANFLETGGAITADLLYKVMDLVMQKEGLKAIFINLYGGINPIHEGAKGIVRYIRERGVNIPIVAKALGNRQEETWEIFKSHGVHVVSGVSTEEGVEQLASLLEGGR